MLFKILEHLLSFWPLLFPMEYTNESDNDSAELPSPASYVTSVTEMRRVLVE